MADNIIKRDIVQLEFQSNSDEIQKLTKMVEELRKNFKGGVGDDELDKLKDSAEKTKKPLDKLKDQVEKVKNKVTELGKKAATTAYNGLKKMAGVSFKALTVGLTAAAAGIAGIVANSVSAYAEYEQLIGGMETLLGRKGAKNVGDYAKIVKKPVDEVRNEYNKLAESEALVMKNANDAFKTSGLSANQYMTTVTGIAAHLKKSTGGDTVEAAKLADMAIQDMSDNANKMGNSMEMIQTVYSNLSRGMYMTLDNLALPYAGTKEGAMEMVNHAAEIDKSVKANDLSYGNLVKAIHAVQVEMDITGTTSTEAFSTITGSMSMAKAAWGNLMPALIQGGDAFDQCVNNLVESLVGFKDEATGKIKGGLINNLVPKIEAALGGVGLLLERLSPILEKELPKLIDKLLPSLITAATALLVSFVKALPNIVKTIAAEIPDILKELGTAISEAFGEQFPALKKFGDFISKNASALAKFVPIVLGLVVAFKLLVPLIALLSKGKGKDEDGEKGGFVKFFEGFAKMKTKTVLKGMLNLAIIFGGLMILTAAFMLVAPYISQLSDIGSVLKLIVIMGALGALGLVLAKLAEVMGKISVKTTLFALANMAIMIAGMSGLLLIVGAVSLIPLDLGRIAQITLVLGLLGLIGGALVLFGAVAGAMPVVTVLLGLANMAIMIAGMSALFMLLGAVSLIKFDYGRITTLILIIGLLGIVGTALSLFGAILGVIPVVVVLLGLANMAIIIAGMTALFLLIGASSLISFDLGRITKIIGIIGLLGTVGSVLTVFAGVVGLIPIPIVLTGLANMALVIGGITALIVAFGALSKIEGFDEFLTSGGETLAKIFNIIGECVGSVIGGLGEGISNSLPKIGENIGKFGENVKPLFASMKGVDMGGVGKFFTALIGLFGLATGSDIIEGIKSFFGGGDEESPLVKMGTDLSTFAEKSKGFFTTFGNLDEGAFAKGQKAIDIILKLCKAEGLQKKTLNLKNVGEEFKSFATSSQTAFGTIESISDSSIEKSNTIAESIKELGNLSFSTANIDAFVNALNSAQETTEKLVKDVGKLPEKMGNALKNASDSLSSSIVEVWKAAVEASIAPVNKLLDGANWILKEFGSTKTVAKWTPYAKGTGGHKGGNALVNDGRGAELVQMPNGRTFIPNGRNVFMPNAPKGMKVLSAERTARLMGRKSPTFHYAEGTGKIDIWDYMDNAKGLISSVSNKFVNYSGMKGLALNIGKGMVSTFKGEMSSWAEKLYDEFGALSLEDYNPSKGVSQWRSTVMRALKMEGLYSAANVARTLFQMQTESGGNPRAINLWDSNAKKGIPSKGLMQVIDPTFKAYARAGFNKNIYDPLSNILASVRYATSRYGSLAKAYRGVGYSNGVGTISMPEQPSTLNLSYSPESGDGYRATSSVEYNTFAPVFNLTISGSNEDRVMERKVKKWINEAMDEVFESYSRKKPRLREV